MSSFSIMNFAFSTGSWLSAPPKVGDNEDNEVYCFTLQLLRANCVFRCQNAILRKIAIAVTSKQSGKKLKPKQDCLWA